MDSVRHVGIRNSASRRVTEDNTRREHGMTYDVSRRPLLQEISGCNVTLLIVSVTFSFGNDNFSVNTAYMYHAGTHDAWVLLACSSSAGGS